jgi:hypothetical protein
VRVFAGGILIGVGSTMVGLAVGLDLLGILVVSVGMQLVVMGHAIGRLDP